MDEEQTEGFYMASAMAEELVQVSCFNLLVLRFALNSSPDNAKSGRTYGEG